MTEPTWYVYLLECQSARIYTGVTPNLDGRINTHRIGRGALFTRINRPQRLLAAKPFPSQRAARLIEVQVKRMPAVGKRLLARLWSEQHPIDERTQQAFAIE